MDNKSNSAILVIILVIFIVVILSYGFIVYSLNAASIHKNTTYSTSQEWEVNTNIGSNNDSRWNLTNQSHIIESEIVTGDIEKEGLKNKTDYWIMVLILIGVVALCLIGLIWYSISELAI